MIVAVISTVYGVYRAVMLNERIRHRILGIKNAKQLKLQQEEICRFCDQEVDAKKDIYDERLGCWYHAACHNQLLRG